MTLNQEQLERTKGARTAEAPMPQRVEEAERPRGAMAVTLLYLLAVVAAWAYMYMSLLERS